MRYAIPAAIAAVALLGGYWLGARDDEITSSPASTQTPFAQSGDGRGTPPALTGTMREQADRLFERIMQARARGDTAEASFFLPMALQAYADVAAAEPLSADQRYHLGLLHEVSGAGAAAAAQADTILRDDPTHLLGLALAARAAALRKDAAAQRAFQQKLVAAEAEEMAKTRPEYEAHRADLSQAIAEAKKNR